MGDVAMMVPVIHTLAVQHPEIGVSVLTKARFKPLFGWMPANVKVIGVETSDYKGVAGLNRLYNLLEAGKYDAVADLHDVLRSKYLKWRFRLAGIAVETISKNRHDRKRLIGHGFDMEPLTPVTQRYKEVLQRLGIDISLDFDHIDTSNDDFSNIDNAFGKKGEEEKWVGVAPFAAHEPKVYPLDKMQAVVDSLVEKGCRVFLFGAGSKESQMLGKWEKPGKVDSVCGKLNGIREEMLLMSRLNVMLAMDSSNMHLAALMGIPVVSIWMATHPKAGFTPWRQPDTNIVQIDEMQCRPCSIYGSKPCRFGDYRCKNISPSTISDFIFETIFP